MLAYVSHLLPLALLLLALPSRVLAAQTSTIQYGVPFCVDSRDPSVLSHGCLIGIGAVTHHFDYGQRYVELLIDTDPANPCPPNTPVRILPPPMA